VRAADRRLAKADDLSVAPREPADLVGVGEALVSESGHDSAFHIKRGCGRSGDATTNLYHVHRIHLRIRLEPYLHLWLDEGARSRVLTSILGSYRETVGVHLITGLGSIALAKLTPADVQAFLNRKQASGLSARRVQYVTVFVPDPPPWFCGGEPTQARS
jgi:hypothetical protein